MLVELGRRAEYQLCCHEAIGLEMRTETKSGQGFTAGVKDYRLTYYMKDYRVHMNDLLAAEREWLCNHQPELKYYTWTDGLTSLDRYKCRSLWT